MKQLLALIFCFFCAHLSAQHTLRIGGEIQNADTFEVRVYAHPVGLISTVRTADKVWQETLGNFNHYIIEFESGKRKKTATIIGFKGSVYDLKLDVNFHNISDIVILKPSANRNPWIRHYGAQSLLKKF